METNDKDTRVAEELKRKNDLYEIELMLRAAESARGAAKYSMGRLGNDGYAIAEELVTRAVDRLNAIHNQVERSH